MDERRSNGGKQTVTVGHKAQKFFAKNENFNHFNEPPSDL